MTVAELISKLGEMFQGDEVVALRVGMEHGLLTNIEQLPHLEWTDQAGPIAGLVSNAE